LRHELLRYLAATSQDRARLIGELTERNPGMADLLLDLETDGDQLDVLGAVLVLIGLMRRSLARARDSSTPLPPPPPPEPPQSDQPEPPI
jgi:hypothetical protein